MTSISSSDEQQILELLAGKVLGDLSPSEDAALEALDQTAYESALEELEQTAAAAHLAFVGGAVAEEMPLSIESRIRSASKDFVRVREQPETRVSRDETSNDLSSLGRAAVAPRDRQAISPREYLAWAACAASILLALGIWQSSQPPSSQAPSMTMARKELVEQAPDLVQISWQPGSTPFETPVTGDVVWSNARQEGFMRFDAMPANDPSIEQYQLWIIDPERDDEPIDGGVFDIPENGEVIVPIQAKLEVVKPAAFAITIEKPGGVVVSDQSRLPLLAPVP